MHPTAPAEAEGAGLFRDRLEPRIGSDQLCQAGLQIGLGLKDVRHRKDCIYQTRKTHDSISRCVTFIPRNEVRASVFS
jgi:hypothetical protein